MKIRTTLTLLPLLIAPAAALQQDPTARPTVKPAERVQDARDAAEKKADRVQDARDKKTADRVQGARDKAQDAADKTADRVKGARDKADETAERVQDARDKKTADRVQDARDKAQGAGDKQRGTKDQPVRVGADRVKGARKVDGVQDAEAAGGKAKDASAKALSPAQRNATLALIKEIETHEKTTARIDKLASIYEKKGDRERLARVETLRTRENARYEKTIARYENLLGKDRFSTVRRRLESAKKAGAEKK